MLSITERSSIATSVTTLQSRLNSYFDTGVSGHFMFGSYTRGTILPRSMDARSDVDYMVVFVDDGNLPQAYLNRLKRFAEAKYATSELFQSTPSIVLELNHIKFELVPALANWLSGYKIPDGANGWQSTDPTAFNKTSSDKNTREGSHLKPVVRLAKLWNARNGYVFSSYLLEKTITDQFFFLCSNQRDYLFAVFDNMAVPTDTQWRRDKVERAKKIVAETRAYEAGGYPALAEAEIKKLIA